MPTDQRTIVRRDPGSSSRGSYGLPPDLVAKARTRIARLAGMLGTLSLIALVLNTTVFADQVDSPAIVVHVLAMGLALVVIATSLSKRVADGMALNAGLAYEVLLCWIISFVSVRVAVSLNGQPPEITWASMVIVMFPMVVPVPPRRLLVASILAAASAPGSLLLLDRLGAYTLTPHALLGTSVGPVFAIALAYLGARMIYAIGLDVSRARLLGAYRLESKLGAGAMGEVWRASHRMLARPAAIKLIAPVKLGEGASEMLARFEREAQATALLRSPHTVEVYDFGRTDDGSFYYVMELLDGLDLNDLVRLHGPLPAPRVVHILRQACHSLGEAHAAGLVHRDVKPANILLCRHGPDLDFVKVLAFGLVKRREDGRDSDLTRQDRLIGTPAFMAPEMLVGGELDGRTDLYALGCVAYWLLTRTLVFEADTVMALAAKHLRDEPVSPSQRTELQIPVDLEAVVMDCLRKEPADRPGSAEELAARVSGCRVRPWTPEDASRWWQLRRPAAANA